MEKAAVAWMEFNIKDADGGFSISVHPRDNLKFWIERIDDDAAGEGMEINASELLAVIRKFYNDNF